MKGFDPAEFLDYSRYSNRQLVAVPLVVLFIALVVIGGWWVVTGWPAHPGIEFTGGSELNLRADASAAEVEAAFEEEVVSVRPVLTAEDTFIVTFRETDLDALEGQAEAAGFEVMSSETTSPSFGADTQVMAVIGVAIAFVGMSVVVFVMFRTFVPSIAVVMSAFSDIMIPLALMNLLGIELTLGTVAALLMIIGYSVDSDILLNNHILRGAGDFYERTYEAMRTGVTMTLTSLSALFVMTIVSYAFGIGLLTAIGIVLIFGLLADLMNTYLLNVTLLRYYRGVDV